LNLNLLIANEGVLPMQSPSAAHAGLLVVLSLFQADVVQAQATPKPAAKPQTRPTGERLKVDPASIQVDDGDSVVIKWPSGDAEIVRILGIDTPETRHLAHNIPFDQSFGPEAKSFAQGAFGAASEVQLLRCTTLDPFGRSLAYLFINGKNYSTLVINAHLAAESVSIYGDNGFPQVAAEMLAAAKEAGPPPFEPPGAYRTRMRVLSEWLKKNGQYPTEK
jgi:micrococcal nuclease